MTSTARSDRIRRTLLAIGVAVLVSMMIAPHGYVLHEQGQVLTGVKGWGPFFSTEGFGTSDGIGCGVIGRVMIDMLVLEIVFLAVLFAIIVNIRWLWGTNNRTQTSTENFRDAVAPLPSTPPRPAPQRVAPTYMAVVVERMIEEQLKKSWFGKPYIECGQSLRLCAHLFELGGVLGAKHSEQLDAFALAFLGEIESAKSHCENVARWLRGRRVTESMTFADYVQAAYLRDCYYTGDAATFLAKHSKDRMERDIVNGMAKLSTEHGFAVGVEYPHLIRAMFQQTATKQKLWVSWSYEEAEEAKNKDFMRYCEQYRPGVYALLRVNTPVR